MADLYGLREDNASSELDPEAGRDRQEGSKLSPGGSAGNE